jgi:hypothetical protein
MSWARCCRRGCKAPSAFPFEQGAARRASRIAEKVRHLAAACVTPNGSPRIAAPMETPTTGVARRRDRAMGRRQHATAQKRQTLEADAGAGTGPQRGIADIVVLGSCALETMERSSPPKPRRDESALRKTPVPTPPGARIRPSGGRVQYPECRAQLLHRTGHTHHRGRGISLSGAGQSPAVNRIVQQSPARHLRPRDDS